MKRIKLEYYFLSFFFIGCINQGNIKSIVTTVRPCVLYESLINNIGADTNIGIYYPYSGLRKRTVRITLGEPYNLSIDVSPGMAVTTFNEISNSRFEYVKLKYFKNDKSLIDKYIIEKLKRLRNFGIHTMGRTNNFIHIQTVFHDSTYSQVKTHRTNYTDGFYEKESEGISLSLAYCICYYVFEKKDNIRRPEEILSRQLTYCSDYVCYYRTPLEGVHNTQASSAEKQRK